MDVILVREGWWGAVFVLTFGVYGCGDRSVRRPLLVTDCPESYRNPGGTRTAWSSVQSGDERVREGVAMVRSEEALWRELEEAQQALDSLRPSPEALRQEAAEAERLAQENGMPPKSAKVIASLSKKWNEFS